MASSPLAAKLAEVMGAVERIPKNGRNEFHRYDYAMEADIVAALRVELAQRGVVLLPGVTGSRREKVGDKGEVLTELDMEFTFWDAESGETITRPWLGAGSDKLDKGAYKAMTGGEKYFLLKAFLIPTGDDPEQEDVAKPRGRQAAAPAPRPTAPAPPAEALITSAQRTRLYTIATNAGWKDAEVKALLKKHLGVESSTQIPVRRYDEFCGLLENGVESAHGQR